MDFCENDTLTMYNMLRQRDVEKSSIAMGLRLPGQRTKQLRQWMQYVLHQNVQGMHIELIVELIPVLYRVLAKNNESTKEAKTLY